MLAIRRDMRSPTIPSITRYPTNNTTHPPIIRLNLLASSSLLLDNSCSPSAIPAKYTHTYPIDENIPSLFFEIRSTRSPYSINSSSPNQSIFRTPRIIGTIIGNAPSVKKKFQCTPYSFTFTSYPTFFVKYNRSSPRTISSIDDLNPSTICSTIPILFPRILSFRYLRAPTTPAANTKHPTPTSIYFFPHRFLPPRFLSLTLLCPIPLLVYYRPFLFILF
ncbi:hypothetical protein AX774_g5407 [Zancudomyces culisetae]|uniref:Uncharacterized protein n=1 Tax=Zancudomyces culisetae TaxID=1213189 RepID=A0A1R1PJK3_ZANCU|nr:hypothetical protein AX774_g5407 [Zancudomyces culisetae]|eukprot:OMH81144.1 hypothetical protein AX774_g5407 [Zancudomyces culisetae]